MNRTWGRFGAVCLLMCSALAIFPSPVGAYEKCLGWTQTPVTVGAAGNPVASTPLVSAYVCVDDNIFPVSSILDDPPRAQVTEHTYWTYPYYRGTSIDLYIPAGLSVKHVRVTYAVGSTSQTHIIPVNVGGSSGQTVCVFYRGDAEVNPGGCLLFVED